MERFTLTMDLVHVFILESGKWPFIWKKRVSPKRPKNMEIEGPIKKVLSNQIAHLVTVRGFPFLQGAALDSRHSAAHC